MTDKYNGVGDKVTVTAAAAIVQGEPVFFGTGMAGVALTSAASGELVSVALEGDFTVAKDDSNIGIGANVYAEPIGKNFTATATGGVLCGKAIAAAGTGASTVRIKLTV